MHRPPSPARFLPPVLALLVLGGQAGCVSSSYRRAAKSAPTPVALGWRAETPTVELTLQTVIAFKGPGSWKENAYWDEYVVTLRNRGPLPVVIERAALKDFLAQSSLPGDQPWDLEKRSRQQTAQLQHILGDAVALGAGIVFPTVGGLVLSSGAAMVSMAGGSVSPLAIWAGPAVLPVAIGATVYRNLSGRHAIEAEFARRRIVLPQTLAPGQELAGSLFFPTTPGPRRLIVGFRENQRSADLDLPLPQLARLHLRNVTEPKTASPVLHPVMHNGRQWLTVSIETIPAAAFIVVNDRTRQFPPVEIPVEVDAHSRLIEDLTLVTTPAGYRPITRVYAAGSVPPARILFLPQTVQETPYAQPENPPPAGSETKD
jgi:hypothetical protein